MGKADLVVGAPSRAARVSKRHSHRAAPWRSRHRSAAPCRIPCRAR